MQENVGAVGKKEETTDHILNIGHAKSFQQEEAVKNVRCC